MRSQSGTRSEVLAITLTMNLGLVAWVVHLVALWGLAHLCAAEPLAAMHATTAATAAVALLGFLIGLQLWRSGSQTAGRSTRGPLRFWGSVGVLLNGFFVVLIVVEGVPVLFLDPCM